MIKFIKSLFIKSVKYWVLPIIAFIGVLAVVLAISLSGLAAADFPEATAAETIEPTPTEAMTKAPVPIPKPTIRKVYIPDPEELQEIPDIITLTLIENSIDAELKNDELTLNWKIDEDTDYYLLCILDEQNKVIQKDILWPDIDEWFIFSYQGDGVLLLSYKDMGEDAADDDELTAAYFNQIAAAPTQAPAGSSENPDTEPDDSAMNKYYIIVDKEDNAFAIFTYDENLEYTKRVATFPCALGRSSRHTPTGTFKISSKGAWKTWSSSQYSPFYTRYTGGLYFHGAIYSRKSADRLVAKYYEQIGSNKTSGCIRTTMAGARWIYYNCPAGTVVETVKSSDLVSYPGKPPIDPEYPRWDPTDPDKPESRDMEYTLTVNITGGGSVQMTPEGTVFAADTAVHLKAVAQSGYRFVKWEDDVEFTDMEIDVAMEADKTITAIFEEDTS